MNPTTHFYPPKELVGDYLRGGAGMAFTGTPLVFASSVPVAGYVLGGLTLLFAGFVLRTGLRHVSRVETSAVGLRGKAIRSRQVGWTEIRKVKLRYYSTRRDRASGWMQMKITGGGTSLEMDSTLTDFEALARRVGEAAVASGAEMDETTRANFALMGLDLINLANSDPDRDQERA